MNLFKPYRQKTKTKERQSNPEHNYTIIQCRDVGVPSHVIRILAKIDISVIKKESMLDTLT